MADQEMIQQLAREYTIEIIGRPNAAWIEEYENFLTWILRDHCIVSREKAKALCRLAVDNSISVDYSLIDGLTDMVVDMFNEDYHKVIDND